MSAPVNRECDQVREDLGEFALGIMSGRDRSRVLQHVAACLDCRDELDALALVSDRLLDLAPCVEPEVGFESRLMLRVADHASRAPRRRGQYVALVAAALLIVVGTLVTSARFSTPRNAAEAPYGVALLSAPLTSHGVAHGLLWVSQGDPAWIFMSLSGEKNSATAQCHITLRGGHVLALGSFSLVNGNGSWAVQVSAPGTSLQSAQITDATGHVLASATLTDKKI